MIIRSYRRKADIGAHMQTDTIEVDFGFITNAGVDRVVTDMSAVISFYFQAFTNELQVIVLNSWIQTK